MTRAKAMVLVFAASLALGGPLAAETKTVATQTLAAPAEPASPTTPTSPATPTDPAVAAPTMGTGATTPAAAPAEPAATDAPQIFYGEDGLPPAVKETRRKIIEATKTGELEALRPIMEANEEPPELSGGGQGDDPIATLKLLSGDDKGREILAILQEVIEAGYVHVDIGTPQEAYVWPYFTRLALNKLTGPQMVELFRLIAAGDFLDMQDKGVYSFYRVGIAPDGTWRFFVDGD